MVEWHGNTILWLAGNKDYDYGWPSSANTIAGNILSNSVIMSEMTDDGAANLDKGYNSNDSSIIVI